MTSDENPSTNADLHATAIAQWQTSIDRIRDTAKWLVVTFGAIGGVLVGTAPLTGLTHLKLNGQGWTALGFAAIALAGIGLVIGMASGLLLPRAVSLHDLAYAPEYHQFRQAADADPSTYLWPYADSVDEFYRLWRRNLRSLRLTDDLYLQHLHDAKAQRAIDAARDVLAERVNVLAPVASYLLMIGIYEHVRSRFAATRIAIFSGGGIAAIGIAGFVALAGTFNGGSG